MNSLQIIEAFIANWEYNDPLKDKFGRNRFYNSPLKNIFFPTTSQYLFDKGIQPKYPSNENFAVCISHDIDYLYTKYSKVRHSINAFKALIQKDKTQFLYNGYSIYSKKVNPAYDIKNILFINNKFKINSTYYFLALSQNDEDYSYELENLSDDINLIQKFNNEIGLHGGHGAYNNIDVLSREKNKIEKYFGREIDGYRNHYLRFTNPITWQHLQQLGFCYDTTYGFADTVGFRNGMCYPFYPYDNEKKDFIDIVELPLIVMDVTLLHYMRLSEERSLLLVKQLIDRVKKCKGIFTLLWHNHLTTGTEGRLYEKILQLISVENAWVTTSRNVVEWWKQNGYLEQQKNILESLLHNIK